MFITLQTLVTKIVMLCSLVFNLNIKIESVECHLITTGSRLEILGPSSTDYWLSSRFPTVIASNISERCISHSTDYVSAFRNQLPWAVRMYESSGKLALDMIHTGSGNIHHESGLFDDCLSVQSPDFQGQYCSVFFDLKPTSGGENETGSSREGEPYEYMSNFRMPSASFCLPSTCSARDLRSAVAQLVDEYRIIDGKNMSIVTLSNEDFCFTTEKRQNNSIKSNLGAKLTLGAFCLLGFVVLLATVHEVWRENYLQHPVVSKTERLGIRYLHCFSALNNSRKLMSTENEVDSITCLYGLRVMSTLWIVIQHTYLETIGRSSYNTKMSLKMAQSWVLKGTANPTVAVDTFFLMSGLLVAFSQIRKLTQNQGVFNLKQFYLHRYFRLTSLYAILIGFVVFLYPYLGSGPDWNYVQLITKSTRKYWWSCLLYILNAGGSKSEHPLLANPSTNLAETWYLSCDMQMFWMSPLFIYPLWRWKRAGLIWTTVALLGFLAVNVAIFTVNDIPPAILPTRQTDMQNFNEYARLHYLKTYARIPPYLIGILLGWLLHKTQTQKLEINKYLVAAGWLASTITSLAVHYALALYFDEAEVPIIDTFFRVSYGALHRTAWALAIGWMIFACTHGYGGYVQRFLSWKFFMPLSRLSYAVYLVHPVYIKAYYSSLRKPMYSTGISLLTTFFGILMASFLIATVVAVVVEMPILNLDKLIIRDSTLKDTKGATSKREREGDSNEKKTK